jgi:putative hemolysin
MPLLNKEGKMKRIIPLTIILIGLTACATLQAPTPDPTAIPPAGLPNPASVYCAQNGNQLEIITAEDGGQSGFCIFPDGSTCDEWAYYRGECGPATPISPTPTMTTENEGRGTGGEEPGSSIPPETTEAVVDWWGVIKKSDPGAQFDDYFERQDLGQAIAFGLAAIDPAVKAQIEALRDTGQIVHLYGTLVSNVPDYNGSQIQVERLEVEE